MALEALKSPRLAGHPKGNFAGQIVSVTRGRSNHGATLELKIKTKRGEVCCTMYPESESSAARNITHKNMEAILSSYADKDTVLRAIEAAREARDPRLVSERGVFDHWTELAPLMRGLPVQIRVSHKEQFTNVSFKPVPPEARVTRGTGAVVERVEY